MQRIVLKPGKEKSIRNRHHWIFSGAVASYPSFEDGDFLEVVSHTGEFLGIGYFQRKSSIVGRMISFEKIDPLKAIENQIDNAIAMRKRLFDPKVTNAFRLINGEGDFLPGLIVDQYNEIAVVQFSTLGKDRLREWIAQKLFEKGLWKGIYEKSLLPSRKEEGLKDRQGWLAGTGQSEIVVLENGLKFHIDFIHGQKTGFFLDHREMRHLIKDFSKGKSVLNCFAYSGGFSVYALAGGAVHVDSVDISAAALEIAKKNVELNGFQVDESNFFAEDVFQFLREKSLNYDIVILDPPAFAKRKKDLIAACRGYKDINRITLQKMPKNSLLLTCSCSYFVDADLFQKVVFQASAEAKRQVRIIGKHHLPVDHPINIFHPEGDYLKSLLLYVE